MKKLFTSIFLASSLTMYSQTFYDSTYVPIPDTSSVCVPITVSGLPSQMDTSFGLASVCFNITHTFDGDLVIRLKSPNGTFITLANNVGMGQNFTNTCLAMNGANGNIANGSSPFTGTFIPQESLNNINDGQNPNGVWNLCIYDIGYADVGALHNFNITFSVNPPPDPKPPPLICNYCVCPGGADTCNLLPDITASALCIQQFHTEYTDSLTYANATPNIGSGPIEIHGIDSCFCNDTIPVSCSDTICPDGSDIQHIVIQRIYQRIGSDTLAFYDRIAGKMSYHPVHGHLHVEDWADISLRTSTANPDATTWPIVGTSVKQSFCLVNFENCTNAYGFCVDTNNSILTMADIPNAGVGLYNGCNLSQGIYPGYLDIYDESLNDPIDLTNICNGNYYIVCIIDPNNHFLESNKNNNWVAVPITLTQQVLSVDPQFTFTPFGKMYAFSADTQNAYSFVWDFGDGAVDSINNPTIHTYSDNGTYTITFTITEYCGTKSSSQTITINTTATEDRLSYYETLKIYPNPTNDEISFSFFTTEKTDIAIQLCNFVGQKVMNIYSSNQSTLLYKKKFSFQEAKISKGMYIIRVVDKSNRILSERKVVYY